jgi:hypothetical protein
MEEVIVSVAGFPPAKNEALSMFGASHSHAERVRLLLMAAEQAIAGTAFQPLTGPIGLEVVLHAPAGSDPWDATNYLGGIADVLQDKGRVGIPLVHLGHLAKVALYPNDRQIREIHYRQEEGQPLGYRVRIWALPG